MQKYPKFWLSSIFGNFFFQNTILVQIGPRTIKNIFSDILS